jgi:hypothetical protein
MLGFADLGKRERCTNRQSAARMRHAAYAVSLS